MSKRYPPEEIVPTLTHHNREARRYAAMMLGIREDDQLVPFLADLLQSESVSARRAAAHALGTPTGSLLAPNRAMWSAPTIDPLAVRSLTASLGDADAVVRANSARSLGDLCRYADWGAQHRDETNSDLLRSDDVALPLINALRDPVAVVRIRAAISLSVLAIPAALPVLIPLLQDPYVFPKEISRSPYRCPSRREDGPSTRRANRVTVTTVDNHSMAMTLRFTLHQTPSRPRSQLQWNVRPKSPRFYPSRPKPPAGDRKREMHKA